MFIETYFLESIDRRGGKHKRLMGRCICDQCDVEFVRGNYDWDKCILEHKPTFCSSKCSRQARKKNGISDKNLRLKNLKLYGVEHTLQLKSIQETAKQTMVEKYGVEKPLQNTEIKKKTIETLQRKYGVSSAYHIPENIKQLDYDLIVKKRINTMKIRGTICSSKVETEFFTLLTKKFQSIERQVRIPDTHWIIDFYIKDINVWIQVDGIYWHGLNRDISELQNSSVSRDVKILRTKYTDAIQNLWFHEQNLRFLRITDKQIKSISTLPENLTELAYFFT